MGENNNFRSTVESLFKGMDSFISSKTVVGDAIHIGETIILPLVDVSFGVGAGSGSNGQKNSTSGAGGMGGKMTPSAVLVIKDNAVKLVNIKNQDAVTKVLDMIPDLVDKFTKPKKKEEQAPEGEEDITDAEVVDIAFPEEEAED